MDFKEAFIEFLSEEGISQASIAENYPREMSPQSLNSMLKSRGTSANKLSDSSKAELLDALVKLNKKKNGSILDALKKSDEKFARVLFDYVRKHYSLINEAIFFTRAEMDSLIECDIEAATEKLVIIGSISRKKLNKTWYEEVEHRLQKKQSLNITLFIESNQALYWRAISLDADADPEVHPQADLIMKNDKLIRELEKQVELKSNGINSENTMKRLKIYEVDFPIMANIINIDENRAYITPRTHLRSSKAATLLLGADYPNALWEQYNNYVEFFLKLAREESGRFIGPREPEDQKILLYSDDGMIPRGVGRRSILDSEPKLITRVVHGLVFSRCGELLLRYRGEKSRDNRDRWDKSCGSIIRPTDVSGKFSIKRTIRKELFETMALDISDTLQKSVYEEGKILDMGEWRGTKGLEQCLDKKEEWYFFELLEPGGGLWPFPGPRYHGESEIVLDFPSIRASIFIIVCNEDFHKDTKELNENYPENKICRWIMPKRGMKLADDLRPQTNDLETYLYDGESNNSLLAKIRQVSLAIKTTLSELQE